MNAFTNATKIFKAGDVVKRIDGNYFSNGNLECTVDYIDGDGDVFLAETCGHLGNLDLEIVQYSAQEGDTFRIKSFDFTIWGDHFKIGEVFTLGEIERGDVRTMIKLTGEKTSSAFSPEHHSDLVERVEISQEVGSNPHTICVGDVYEVIDITPADGPSGLMWKGDYPVGSTFTIKTVDYDTGRWDCGNFYLKPEWVGTKVKYIRNINDDSATLTDIQKETSKGILDATDKMLSITRDNTGFKSTVYDITYDTLEEAMVNEMYYDLIEKSVKLVDTANYQILETITEAASYETRKAIVMEHLAIEEA